MVEVRPVEGQIDDLLSEINAAGGSGRAGAGDHPHQEDGGGSDRPIWKTWVCAVRYMHHDVDTIERMEMIRDLRLGEFDVLVGINLLREGLDIPEVSLVAILDADKEGFLRSETSLIQTIGRAARNDHGKVIMYADAVTGLDGAGDHRNATAAGRSSMTYNEEHGIIPKTIKKDVREILEISTKDVGRGQGGSKKRMSAAGAAGDDPAADAGNEECRQDAGIRACGLSA